MKKRSSRKKLVRKVNRLLGTVRTLRAQLAQIQSEYNRRETEWDRAGMKNRQYEEHARENVRKSLDLQYLEVSGNKPILWVNSPDPTVVNHGTFANIVDRLKRIAPGIEMIVLTYGDVRLWELSSEDLAKLGLARITDHPGGMLGAYAPSIEDKRGPV